MDKEVYKMQCIQEAIRILSNTNYSKEEVVALAKQLYEWITE